MKKSILGIFALLTILASTGVLGILTFAVPLKDEFGNIADSNFDGIADAKCTMDTITLSPLTVQGGSAISCVSQLGDINWMQLDDDPAIHPLAAILAFGFGTTFDTVAIAGPTSTNAIVTSTGGKVVFAISGATPLPSISSFTPKFGPVGTAVTITGSGFTGATGVEFASTTAFFFVVNDNTITATVPVVALTGPIKVITPAGTATSATPFTVIITAPTISSFSPASGPVGTAVTITGQGFTGATMVTFGTAQATFVVNSDTQITATVPAGATTGPISVATSAGIATSATSFTVIITAPTISSFTPTSGPVGTIVTITGTNFESGLTTVYFGDTPTVPFFVEPIQIQVDVPPITAGSYPVTVTTPLGSAVAPTNFVVTAAPTTATVHLTVHGSKPKNNYQLTLVTKTCFAAYGKKSPLAYDNCYHWSSDAVSDINGRATVTATEFANEKLVPVGKRGNEGADGSGGDLAAGFEVNWGVPQKGPGNNIGPAPIVDITNESGSPVLLIAAIAAIVAIVAATVVGVKR